MTEVRVIVQCPETGLIWAAEAAVPACAAPGHVHREHQVHRHRDPVTVPGGPTVTGVSFDLADPYARVRMPDFGLYLDRRWDPPWPHEHLAWPDFGVPDDRDRLHHALTGLLDRAGAGEQVEIGCLGGHGRTGTALAALAICCGARPSTALEWVRAAYCERAVETVEQERLLDDLGG